jgi:hypothetical protein
MSLTIKKVIMGTLAYVTFAEDFAGAVKTFANLDQNLGEEITAYTNDANIAAEAQDAGFTILTVKSNITEGEIYAFTYK